MTQAMINPALLSWSRTRAGLTEEQLAKGLPVKPEKVMEWEAGVSLPTFKQAQKWAAVAHIPFGFLFLRKPPEETLPLPDLRTITGTAPTKPSVNLLDTVKDALRKRDWYLEYLIDHAHEPLSFVGKFGINSPIKNVVSDIRKSIGVESDTAHGNWEEYSRTLIEGIENAGILVMRSGIALGNTHRKLDVGEFRGFAVSDRLAPLIFINAADAPTARLFTLIHELAHIWIGSSGISDGGSSNGRKEEAFCNAVAGEFLAPETEYRGAWDSNVEWRANLPSLANKFHVSKLVICRRARDLGYISDDDYTTYYRESLKAFKDQDGGGDYYRTAAAKNSVRFSKAVLAETLSGRLLLRDAARLLGMQPAKLRTYAKTIME